jgi:hypothetical protein
MIATLEADRVRVAEIEAQILNSECSPSALQIEQARAKQRLDSYKFPVLTLPNEIVSEIFLHFIPAYPRSPPLTGILSPTCLTHICRQWREIALATHALWRSVLYSHNDPIPFERQVHISDTWLRRSRSYPLSVQMIKNDRLHASGLLAAIIPHRARWEYLRLDFWSTRLLPTIVGPMPLLRHLDLAFIYVNHDNPIDFCELHTAVAHCHSR